MRLVTLESAQRGAIPWHDSHPDVYGLLVDVAQQNGHAAIAALGDDTASFYTETGGPMGLIKGRVAAAPVQRLLETTQAHLSLFSVNDDGSRSEVGAVRFHVVSKDAAGRFAEIPTEAFWGRADHALMPVIIKVQEVLYAIRTGGAR